MTFGGRAIRFNVVSGVGVSKSVLHHQGTPNIFNTQQRRTNVLAGGVNSHNVDKIESRFVRRHFSYKFGNKNGKASQRRDTGTGAEKARMNN